MLPFQLSTHSNKLNNNKITTSIENQNLSEDNKNLSENQNTYKRIDNRSFGESRNITIKNYKNLYHFYNKDTVNFFITVLFNNHSINKGIISSEHKYDSNKIVFAPLGFSKFIDIHQLRNNLNLLKNNETNTTTKLYIDIIDTNNNINDAFTSEFYEHYHNAFLYVCNVNDIPLKNIYYKESYSSLKNLDNIIRDPIIFNNKNKFNILKDESLDWRMVVYKNSNNKYLKIEKIGEGNNFLKNFSD